MRRALLLAVLAVAVLGLNTYAEAVTIEFWHAMNSFYEAHLSVLIDEFMEENPDITVKLVYQGYYGDLHQKIHAAVVGGNPPTIAEAYSNALTPIAEVLYPIGPHMTEFERNDLVDGLVANNTYDGVLTTVPFNKSIMVLYYNADLIDTPPTTWEEFYTLAEQLTEGERFGTGFSLSRNPEQFLNLLEQAGGSILSADWTECVIDSPEALTAMQFAESLVPYSFITDEYFSDHFPAKLAMFVDTSAGYYYYYKAAEEAGASMGVALAPAGPVNNKTMIQGTNLAVFDGDNLTQAQKDAAVKLARFLISPESQAFWSVQTGHLPVIESGYGQAEWLNYAVANDYMLTLAAAMLNGFDQILYPCYGDIRDNLLGIYFEEVMLGANDAATALADLKEEIDLVMAECKTQGPTLFTTTSGDGYEISSEYTADEDSIWVNDYWKYKVHCVGYGYIKKIEITTKYCSDEDLSRDAMKDLFDIDLTGPMTDLDFRQDKNGCVVIVIAGLGDGCYLTDCKTQKIEVEEASEDTCSGNSTEGTITLIGLIGEKEETSVSESGFDVPTN